MEKHLALARRFNPSWQSRSGRFIWRPSAPAVRVADRLPLHMVACLGLLAVAVIIARVVPA